jgi:hypothetical protein
MGFSEYAVIISLDSINKLMSDGKCCIFCGRQWTFKQYVVYTNFYFKGLKLKKNFKEQDVSNDAVSVILHVSLFPKLIWMLSNCWNTKEIFDSS